MQARRSRLRLLPFVACCGLASGLRTGQGMQSALAQPVATRAAPAGPTDALSGPLTSAGAESRIRTLAWSKRPTAAAQLAEYSLSTEVTNQAKTLLFAVRALSRQAAHPAVQKALLQHLLASAPGDEPAVRTRARTTAAFALAAGGQADGVRALVLLATGPDDSDEDVTSWARAALLAHPPDPALLAAALPWLESSARAEKLAWISEERSARSQRLAARCQQARSILPKLGELPTSAAAAILSDLAVCAPGAGPTLDDWQKLSRSSPLWALRGMAALGQGAQGAEWHRLAQAKLVEDDAVMRSAAAWFLASVSSKNADQLAQDPRAEVSAAARNQRTVAGISHQTGEGPCAGAGDESSTKDVFERFVASTSENGAALLGCLASRLRATPGPGLTAAELEQSFGDSSAVTRVLVARGLAGSSVDAAHLARGLAERLYASEPDAYVRRFLCAALVELGLGVGRPLAQELEALDSDPVCRALGGRRSWGALGTPTLATATTAKRYLAARVLDTPVWLEAAPDGFVGARVLQAGAAKTLDPLFVDCPESGEPNWACGPTALRPR